MSVQLHWTVACPDGIEEAALVRAAEAALEHGGRAGEAVELILVSDEELAELHGRFLQDPSVTDVMAFDLSGDGEEGPAGEVYASVDCARRVAKARGVAIQRELALYVVHGCLHLCGFDDHEDEDRERMRRAESQVMSQLGYDEDLAPHDHGSS